MKPGLSKILTGVEALWRKLNRCLGQKQRHELVVWTFFLGYLFIGYHIYDDYGISMDEPIQRKHGVVSLEYVNRQLGEPFNIPNIYNIDIQYYDHKDYGVIFQMGCYAMELMLGLKDSRDIFLLRHALVFLLFWISAVYFYKLLEYHFIDWRLALLGAIFLVLSPRIFANAFYNPKDIPLLSWCILSAYTMLRFLDSRSLKYGILHGFACAMAINTRIVAVYIPVVTLGVFLFDRFRYERLSMFNKTNVTALVTFLGGLIIFTIAIWPFLWQNTIENFLYAFSSMSRFRWYNTIFFMDEFYYPQELPWYHIPVWIAISTPIVYQVLFVIGMAGFIRIIIRERTKVYSSNKQRNLHIFVLLLLIPLVAVVVLKSTLYNGWRHMYFVYPFFILVTISGFDFLIKNKWEPLFLPKVKYVVIPILAFHFIYITVEMIRDHPFQNIFFERLIIRDPSKAFELDYYGLSFKKALLEMLNQNSSDTIHVAFSNFSGVNNLYILPFLHRKRINVVEADDAEFYIINYKSAKDNTYSMLQDKILLSKLKVKKQIISETYIVKKKERRIMN
jgi:hypothetical protein